MRYAHIRCCINEIGLKSLLQENHSNTRKPARSEEEKRELYEKIIGVGAEMFASEQGFSTRKLANRLSMTQGNLYNYVTSKRELWIAIRKHDFELIKTEFSNAISSHSGSYIDLIEKLMIFFLDYSDANPNSWKMMFLIDPPKSNKKGPLEENYEPIQLFEIILNLFNLGSKKGEIRNVSPLVLYSLAVGAVLTEMDIKISERSKVNELISDSSLDKIDIANFRKSLIETVRYILTP
ncbi:MAG: TetR/AcrR family transcriptional regulator [Promethearchaeota archaeon]|nr:MAG: TetR/AcrR family transcriptional regulator [Candidatus Lokiarchaeota archaeon]